MFGTACIRYPVLVCGVGCYWHQHFPLDVVMCKVQILISEVVLESLGPNGVKIITRDLYSLLQHYLGMFGAKWCQINYKGFI